MDYHQFCILYFVFCIIFLTALPDSFIKVSGFSKTTPLRFSFSSSSMAVKPAFMPGFLILFSGVAQTDD